MNCAQVECRWARYRCKRLAVGYRTPDGGGGEYLVTQSNVRSLKNALTLWVGRAHAVLLLSRGCVLGSLSAVRHGCDGSEVQNGW